MRPNLAVPVLGVVLIALAGCNRGVETMNDPVDADEMASKPVSMSTTDQSAPARVITIEPTPGILPPADTDPLPVVPTRPLDEIVESVAEDGTVTLELGNRFMRPLMARVGCDGKITQSHEPVSFLAENCDATLENKQSGDDQ